MRQRINWVVAGIVLAAGLGGLPWGAAPAEAAEFRNPMISGHRLDWCRNWATDCGQPAADAFCRARGYPGATSFAPAHNIGASSPTKVISTGQICDQAFCDGFSRITCRETASREFTNPSLGGYRLDWCRSWAAECGQPAADAFCRAKGYSRAIGYAPAHDIGASTPTRVFSTGQICDQAFCDGFSSITCR